MPKVNEHLTYGALRQAQDKLREHKLQCEFILSDRKESKDLCEKIKKGS